MLTDTIIDADFAARPAATEKSHLHLHLPDALPSGFKIRAARGSEAKDNASELIERRYAWRGYSTSPLAADPQQRRMTLVATAGEQTVGTMTLNLDSGEGLAVDLVFPAEVGVLRAQGRRMCEFTKLAVEAEVHPKRVLASLFHVAYLYAHRIAECDCVLVEVNPRHVNYYRRSLGFSVLSEPRANSRVNAPAVLMWLAFEHTRSEIERFGLQQDASESTHSLYPFALTPGQEAAVMERLRPVGAFSPA